MTKNEEINYLSKNIFRCSEFCNKISFDLKYETRKEFRKILNTELSAQKKLNISMIKKKKDLCYATR